MTSSPSAVAPRRGAARRQLLRAMAAGLSGACLSLALLPVPARASALDDLRDFAQKARSGRADFTQTVTSPDGARKKVSHGSFEFQRPGRFRFSYEKPYAQSIVSNGDKVWIFDPDLNQVTIRKFGDALGSTPAALLVSANLESVFTLAAQPDADGLQWVQATPRQAEGTVRQLRLAFRDHQLAVMEIQDSFGQKSRLVFEHFAANTSFAADHFQFQIPAGADVAGP